MNKKLKIRNKKCICKECNNNYFAADVKSNTCNECIEKQMIELAQLKQKELEICN